MLARYCGNFPADDARNAVSQVRGGIFAETLREATVASAEQWPFLPQRERRRARENSYTFYLRTSLSRVFFLHLSHQRFSLKSPPIKIKRKRKMWRKNNKLDAQFLPHLFVLSSMIN